MALKTILVCLTTPGSAETLLKTAVPLARKHCAHLIGLHTLEALMVYPGIAMHIPDPALASFNASQKEDSNAIRATFEKITDSEDFVSEFRLLEARSVTASTRMIESARAADLVIMAHEDKASERYDQREAQMDMIRNCGRPVVIVPPDYEGPVIGGNIVLGWSDTREATRAAHDLMQLADPDAEVRVLRVGKRHDDTLRDDNGNEMTEMFARHGFKATLDHRESAGDKIANVITQTAFEQGADLIVTGAFGHSRAYDMMLGATTYSLLRDQNVPVMFSR